MTSVLVTGATGFWGIRAVSDLLAHGYAVQALLLPFEDPASFRARVEAWGAPLERLKVSVQEFEPPEGKAPLLADCEVVLHLAGTYRGDRLEVYRAAHRGLLEALLAWPGWTPAHRLFVASSVAATGPTPHGDWIHEREPCRPVGIYSQTKAEAEDYLTAKELPFRTCLIRPPSLFGPGDENFFECFVQARKGVLPFLSPPGARFQMLLIDDLLRATRALLELPREKLPEKVQIVPPQVLTTEDFLAALENVIGKPLRLIPLTGWLGRGLASLHWVKERLGLGAETLSFDKLTIARAGDWIHSPETFQGLLPEFRFTPLLEALAGTDLWYRQLAWIEGRRELGPSPFDSEAPGVQEGIEEGAH